MAKKITTKSSEYRLSWDDFVRDFYTFKDAKNLDFLAMKQVGNC